MPTATGSSDSRDLELDCEDSDQQGMVGDYDPDPDGGHRTAFVALRRHLRYESRRNNWPRPAVFRRLEGQPWDDGEVYEYVEGGRRLAVVFARDLGESWLVTSHEFCRSMLKA